MCLIRSVSRSRLCLIVSASTQISLFGLRGAAPHQLRASHQAGAQHAGHRGGR